MMTSLIIMTLPQPSVSSFFSALFSLPVCFSGQDRSLGSFLRFGRFLKICAKIERGES